MKTVRMIGMVVFAILFGTMITSCGDNSDDIIETSSSSRKISSIVYSETGNEETENNYFVYSSDGRLKQIEQRTENSTYIPFSYVWNEDMIKLKYQNGDCATVYLDNSNRIDSINNGYKFLYNEEGYLEQVWNSREPDINFIWKDGNLSTVGENNNYRRITYNENMAFNNMNVYMIGRVILNISSYINRSNAASAALFYLLVAHPDLLGNNSKNAVYSILYKQGDDYTYKYVYEYDKTAYPSVLKRSTSYYNSFYSENIDDYSTWSITWD
jgi:hypothetical protein